jgi:hypothetical protein
LQCPYQQSSGGERSADMFDAPVARKRARLNLASNRPPNRLTTHEASRRFDVPRPTILDWCKRDESLAVRQHGTGGINAFRWMIDPARLGVLLAVGDRISIEKAAEQFGVPSDSLHGHDPAHLGRLLAELPLQPNHNRRKRRPSPRTRATEAGHASSP